MSSFKFKKSTYRGQTLIQVFFNLQEKPYLIMNKHESCVGDEYVVFNTQKQCVIFHGSVIESKKFLKNFIG
jgi:hypothetical protein